jgi:hypothetical protein
MTAPLIAFRLSKSDAKAACKSPDGDELSRAIRDVSDTIGVDWGITFWMIEYYAKSCDGFHSGHTIPTCTYESVPIKTYRGSNARMETQGDV